MIFLGNINLMSMIFLWNIIMMIIDCYPIHQDKKCDPDYLPQMIMMIIIVLLEGDKFYFKN